MEAGMLLGLAIGILLAVAVYKGMQRAIGHHKDSGGQSNEEMPEVEIIRQRRSRKAQDKRTPSAPKSRRDGQTQETRTQYKGKRRQPPS